MGKILLVIAENRAPPLPSQQEPRGLGPEGHGLRGKNIEANGGCQGESRTEVPRKTGQLWTSCSLLYAGAVELVRPGSCLVKMSIYVRFIYQVCQTLLVDIFKYFLGYILSTFFLLKNG